MLARNLAAAKICVDLLPGHDAEKQFHYAACVKLKLLYSSARTKTIACFQTATLSAISHRFGNRFFRVSVIVA